MRVTGIIREIRDKPSLQAKHHKDLVLEEPSGGTYRLQLSRPIFKAMELSNIKEGDMLTGEVKGHLSYSKNNTAYNNLHLINFER